MRERRTLFVAIAVGVVLAIAPVPSGLTPQAWRYFAIFAATVLCLVFEPIAPAAAGLVAVSFAAAVGVVEPTPGESILWALSGFSNATVWLIFAAFVFALGYEKTGLGRRIALVLVRALGRRPLGLGYAVALTDLMLSPVTVSNTARSAGTVYPIVRHVPGLLEQRSPAAARRLGAYLMWTAFATTCVTSSMFLTALAPNLLAVEIVSKTTGTTIDWVQWVRGVWPVGVPLLVLVPAGSYVLFRPNVDLGPDVTGWADAGLTAMGPVAAREVLMAALAAVALGLWVFGRELADPATVALLVVSAMVLTGLVTWEDILGHRVAWNVLAWFATLVALADGLNRVGFIAWLARMLTTSLAGLSPVWAVIALVVVFFLVHYLFASITAHVTAVLPIILGAASAIPGVPVPALALLLCYSLGLMGVITPYATGPAPVYFASGYLGRRVFWGCGLLFGLIYLAALIGLGATRIVLAFW